MEDAETERASIPFHRLERIARVGPPAGFGRTILRSEEGECYKLGGFSNYLVPEVRKS